MTTTRKLIDVPSILAVLDAEKHLVSGTLATAVDVVGGVHAFLELSNSEILPEPGPLAVANCEHVGRCAMGALIYATGQLTFKQLNNLNGEPVEWPLPVVKALYDSYGLQRYHATQIVGANDETAGDDMVSIAARRERVKNRVRQLAATQSANPEGNLINCQSAETDACDSNEQEKRAFIALDLGEPSGELDDRFSWE